MIWAMNAHKRDERRVQSGLKVRRDEIIAEALKRGKEGR
jgi:hypothetical protein